MFRTFSYKKMEPLVLAGIYQVLNTKFEQISEEMLTFWPHVTKTDTEVCSVFGLV